MTLRRYLEIRLPVCLRSGVLLLLLSLTAFAQPITLRITGMDVSQFPSVRLRINIIRDRNITFNPNSAQYQLLENGVVQKIDRIDCSYDSLTRLTVALLIDRSGSMAQKPGPRGTDVTDFDSVKIRSAKAAVRAFISQMGDKDEAAVYSFSSSTIINGQAVQPFTVNQNFTKDTALLRRSLVPIFAGGGTYLWQAVKRSIDSLRLRFGRKYLIVLTDGQSSAGDATRQSAIAAAIAAKIPVYTIGLGASVSTNELTDIANQTGGKYYYAPGPETLEQIYSELGKIILSDGCELRYISTNPCLDGTRRDISLSVSGGGYYAEADTSFVVPDRLTSYTLSIEQIQEIIAGDKVEVPLDLREFISPQEPLNFDITVRYDTALLASPRLALSSTITEGAPVQMQEPSPGRLRLQLSNFTPTRTSGMLLRIEFTTRVIRRDTLAPVQFEAAVFAQSCPTRLTLEGGGVGITPCRADYLLSSDSLTVGSSGGSVRLPVRIDPPPRLGDPVSISVDIFTDPASVSIDSVLNEGTVSRALNMTLTPIAGGVLRVRFEGTVTDTSDILFYLKLSILPTRTTMQSVVTLGNLALDSRCVTTINGVPFHLLAEGICDRIAVAVPAVSTLRNHPNPFNPSTQVIFTIPRDGHARIEVRDMLGRPIARLLDEWRPAGEYRLPFDGADLPSGYYMALLTFEGKQTSRRMLLVR